MELFELFLWRDCSGDNFDALDVIIKVVKGLRSTGKICVYQQMVLKYIQKLKDLIQNRFILNNTLSPLMNELFAVFCE